MSTTRPTIDSTQPSPMQQAALPFVTALLTGSLIGLGVYPIDYLQTRIQIGTPNTGIMTKSFFLANYKTMFAGFVKSLQASWVKNGVISQKDNVHEHCHEVITGKQSTPTFRQRFYATFATAGVIGFLDTTFTHPFKNYRIAYAKGVTPAVETWRDKFKFIKIGYPLAMFCSMTNAGFCIGAKTILEPYFNRTYPTGQNAFNIMATNIMAGMLSGILVTPIQKLSRRQVSEADPTTHKALSAWKTAKALYQANGLKSFVAGWQGNAATSMIAFGIINGIDFEKYANLFLNLIFLKNKAPASTPTFFQALGSSTPRFEEITEDTTPAAPTPGKS